MALMESKFAPAGRENVGVILVWGVAANGTALLLEVPGAGTTGCTERRKSPAAGDAGSVAWEGAALGVRLSAILSRASVSKRPFEIMTRYPERAATGSLYQAVILAVARIAVPSPAAGET